ncbi:MAG: VOC family protein [Flavobacteriia bacterium]|nr:VOC family protein [Flavobacteriia bacterium]
MKLNQLTIPCRNIENSIHFYKKLGFQLIVYTKSHYARFIAPDKQASFSLHISDNPSTENGIWIYFECDHLDEKVRELIHVGIEFEELPNDKPWLWREARLKDLDGNILILYFAGENRMNPPWRINSF